MRLSRDGRFASEERPRSCLVKGGGLWLLRQGNLGCCCSDVMRGVGGKACGPMLYVVGVVKPR